MIFVPQREKKRRNNNNNNDNNNNNKNKNNNKKNKEIKTQACIFQHVTQRSMQGSEQFMAADMSKDGELFGATKT